MAAAQDGDREAYAIFLQAVTPFLREAASRAAPDPGLAERIVQEALVTIHRLRHTYDPRRPITPWLAGVLSAEARRARIAPRNQSFWRAATEWRRPRPSPA
jgi:RNA polymerase sigma-70 factor (ECF subfamily)